jgi:hypothetical protein
MADGNYNHANPSFFFSKRYFLVLLVNDSEYSELARQQRIRPSICIYLVSPGARCCCCGSCGFLLLLLRAPTHQSPRPLFWGREVPKK